MLPPRRKRLPQIYKNIIKDKNGYSDARCMGLSVSSPCIPPGDRLPAHSKDKWVFYKGILHVPLETSRMSYAKELSGTGWGGGGSGPIMPCFCEISLFQVYW